MGQEIKIGKIESVSFGVGGYQESMIGIYFTLSGKAWGVGDSRSAWDAERISWSKHCKWTDEDRDAQYAEIMRFISKTLSQAKCENVNDLKGKPVEVTFEGMALKSWRILEEAL